MKAALVIAKKEVRSFFDSLIAYVLLALFLGITGYFTWLAGNDFFLVKQATLRNFFGIAQLVLFFVIPALTMRMFAEENRTGTLEFLQTKSISDWQIVLGKFFACWMLVAVALLLTIPFYITVWQLGPIDHGATLTGYLGLFLMSAAFIGIGLLASSITNNQIVAFLLALVVGALLQFVFVGIANESTGIVSNIFGYLNMQSHYTSLARGVIDTRDIIYFFSITMVTLIAAEAVLGKRNYKNAQS